MRQLGRLCLGLCAAALVTTTVPAAAQSGFGTVFVENWGNFQRNEDGTNQWKYEPRLYIPYHFDNGVTFTQRVDVPMIYTNSTGAGNPNGGFCVRQLRDMKLSAMVELFGPVMMTQYAEICGWALARAHARSGAPTAISGYLGKSDVFDQAIAKSSVAYADQSERDHDVLRKAAQAGRVEVVLESE